MLHGEHKPDDGTRRARTDLGCRRSYMSDSADCDSYISTHMVLQHMIHIRTVTLDIVIYT